MAMTEALATTGAQAIPVFALAGVLEVRTALRRPWIPRGIQRTMIAYLRVRLQIFLKMLLIVAWVIIGGTSFLAEGICLDYLRNPQAPPQALGVSIVVFSMEASMGLLVIFPLYLAFFTGERKNDRASAELAVVREELRQRRRRGDRLIDILLHPPVTDYNQRHD